MDRRGQPGHPVKETVRRRHVNRTILVVIGLAIGALLVLSALAREWMAGHYGFGLMRGFGYRGVRGFGPGMMGGWTSAWGWEGALYMGAMIIFWVLIGVGVFFLVKYLAGSGQTSQVPATTGESALDIAKRRYANGEITKEQFEQLKQDLS